MASCACTDYYTDATNASPPYWSPPTPVLSVYESSLSQDDASSSSSPSSPSSTSWPYSSVSPYQHYHQQQHQQQKQSLPSSWTYAPLYDRDIVLPSVSTLFPGKKQEWPAATTVRRESGISFFYS